MFMWKEIGENRTKGSLTVKHKKFGPTAILVELGILWWIYFREERGGGKTDVINR